MKFVAFVLVAFFVNFLYAGYENTNWGMTIDEVKKLYPNGELVEEQSGIINYNVVREISNHPNVLLMFTFSEEKKLRSAMLSFAMIGEKIDLKVGLFTELSKKDCESKYMDLEKALLSKYEKVYFDKKSTHYVNYIDKDNIDTVTLAKLSNNKSTCSPVILYEKYDKNNKSKLKGL